MEFTRRSFLKSATIATIGIGTTACSSMRPRFLRGHDSGGDFTFAHLTDMHVRAKRKGNEGYAACIETVNALRPRPDFVLMGGDLAFDGNYTPKDEFEHQIHLYKSVSDQLEMPYYNAIGNHDALGWSNARKVEVDDPDIGLDYIMSRIGMEKPYYSFDHKGWHFVVLNTTYGVQTERGPSQQARIGDEQLEWLRYDLGAAAGKPTVAMMHIAAFCNMGQVNGDPEAKAMTGMVVSDNKQLRQIFERHGVKAVLQGHSHWIEDYYFNGVWYITSQAVSAAWWSGNWTGYDQGYTILAARDGELTWERVVYPWEHYLEPEDTLERNKISEREAFLKEQQELLAQERAGIAVPS